MAQTNGERYFVKRLLKWNDEENVRAMPWKGEKNPYRIWLSEIILQQTQVAQGLAYYNRFIDYFPTIHDLADAADDTVFKMWEGLGYYTRCKNLLATARNISKNNNGQFPDAYDNILALKGIGPYTAAAIASFAYNLPHAVVDGNVFRVLSRYFGIATPIDSTDGKKLFTNLANHLLDKKNPGIYNQALMDFGAVICKPQLPLCSSCVVNKSCEAFQQDIMRELPVKEKSITKKIRWLYYLVIECDGNVYVRRRAAGDIWENLYDFVLVENNEALALENIKSLPAVKKIFGKQPFTVTRLSKLYKQLLTHQVIQGQFIHIHLDKPMALEGYTLVPFDKIRQLPFPKFIDAYLKDKNVSLNLF